MQTPDSFPYNNSSQNGYTALMWAISKGNNEIAELILARNGDVNIQTKNGETALIRAASSNNHIVGRLLLEQGADPDVQTKVIITKLPF